ncbi:MAG: DMT family transporter [Planctomycetes bacterium]|nr:DMT family transporter [Planctomycetota bacterium]
MHSDTLARWQLFGAAAIFSTGGAAIKSCGFSDWQVAGFRSGIAAVALLALLPQARRLPNWRAAPIAVAYAATLLLFVHATKHTTSANAIFLQSTAPLYVLLLGPIWLREALRIRDLPFLALVAGGLACIFLGGGAATHTAPDPARGNILAVASGLSWACTLTGLRWLGLRAGAAAAAAEGDPAIGAVVAGNVLAFAVGLWHSLPVAGVDAKDVVLLLYLGVFQIGLAYKLAVAGLARVRALDASLILLVEPALNPIWAWLVHGEVPGCWALAGGAAILCATAAQSWFAQRGARSATSCAG